MTHDEIRAMDSAVAELRDAHAHCDTAEVAFEVAKKNVAEARARLDKANGTLGHVLAGLIDTQPAAAAA